VQAGHVFKIFRTLLVRVDRTIEDLTDFRSQALSRLAVQHEEITRLRSALSTPGNVITLPDRLTRA
jgi:hypothetical protein